MLYNKQQWQNGIVFVKNNKVMCQKLRAKINSVLQTITRYSARAFGYRFTGFFYFARGLLKYLNNYSRKDWENLSEFFK